VSNIKINQKKLVNCVEYKNQSEKINQKFCILMDKKNTLESYTNKRVKEKIIVCKVFCKIGE
jgi:hypothetical protein